MLLLLSCEIRNYLTQTAGLAQHRRRFQTSRQIEEDRWAQEELLQGLAEIKDH